MLGKVSSQKGPFPQNVEFIWKRRPHGKSSLHKHLLKKKHQQHIHAIWGATVWPWLHMMEKQSSDGSTPSFPNSRRPHMLFLVIRHWQCWHLVVFRAINQMGNIMRVPLGKMCVRCIYFVIHYLRFSQVIKQSRRISGARTVFHQRKSKFQKVKSSKNKGYILK